MGFFKNARVLFAATKSSTASTAKSSTASVKKPSDSSRTAAKGASRSSGITKPYPVSPALRKFLGVPEASRSDAVKKIWEHIKHNNLQVLKNDVLQNMEFMQIVVVISRPLWW